MTGCAQGSLWPLALTYFTAGASSGSFLPSCLQRAIGSRPLSMCHRHLQKHWARRGRAEGAAAPPPIFPQHERPTAGAHPVGLASLVALCLRVLVTSSIRWRRRQIGRWVGGPTEQTSLLSPARQAGGRFLVGWGCQAHSGDRSQANLPELF